MSRDPQPDSAPGPLRPSAFDFRAALRSPFFLGACLAVAVLLCYLPAIGAGFVWDDDLLVTDNPLVKGADSLPYIWASSAATDYTPLTTTAFWLQWHLWADNATGYHLVNILLQALSVILLWRVLSRLAIPGAWLGALLFAIHPVNVASVAWIAELKNALSLPFYLAAILAFLDFLRAREPAPYALAILAAAAALLCKGSTVILPLVLLLCIWWKHRRITGRDFVTILPFIALAAAAALVTIHFQSRVMDTSYIPLSLPLRIARAGHALWFYLAKDIWPVQLCAIYPKWPVVHSFLFVGLAAAMTLLLWLARERFHRGLFFAWTYFCIALLPVLGILKMTFLDQAFVADWWQQLALPAVTALAGASIAVAWRATPLPTGRAMLATAVAALLLSLGALTWTQASAYSSMETLCRQTLAINPDAWSAHNNLGDVLSTQGHLQQAAAEYQTALRLKPSNPTAHSNLGTVYQRLHCFDDAIAEYHAALNAAPDNARVWFNLGNALRAQGRNPEVIDAFNHAIDNNARWTTPRYELGTILLESGRAAEAGRQAQTIVAIDPAGLSGHYLLARAAAAIGRFDVATTEAAKALEIARTLGDQSTIRQMQSTLSACQSHQLPTAPPL